MEKVITLTGVSTTGCCNNKPHLPHLIRAPGGEVLLCYGKERPGHDYDIIIIARKGGETYNYYGRTCREIETTTFLCRFG